ncbi:hypothetical protein GUITHDRAFT_103970 [Guillardia theta CCMP2712]|uniref:Uncharacterized protein n=1 Tax=Guillardia theta (strain CCMP2712) TaxID=905079 RepID=L1JNW9_GUITC|nr:hypothetical protein GUITHDRAFT_103970 [Guillardia theta CCMP2712]EKX50157.1 hypothetical protein GUITHDRAFT_103970 [Guillardia theta CCMP2712]|eukprot:XP_005837137.1 hypothetical protein GUITHDRAFT_103970 [Guillardia theta CCMP2712]
MEIIETRVEHVLEIVIPQLEINVDFQKLRERFRKNTKMEGQVRSIFDDLMTAINTWHVKDSIFKHATAISEDLPRDIEDIGRTAQRHGYFSRFQTEEAEKIRILQATVEDLEGDLQRLRGLYKEDMERMSEELASLRLELVDSGKQRLELQQQIIVQEQRTSEEINRLQQIVDNDTIVVTSLSNDLEIIKLEKEKLRMEVKDLEARLDSCELTITKKEANIK